MDIKTCKKIGVETVTFEKQIAEYFKFISNNIHFVTRLYLSEMQTINSTEEGKNPRLYHRSDRLGWPIKVYIY